MKSEIAKKIKEQYELGFLPSHMTHLDNLEKIISASGLHSLNALISSGHAHKDISNASVQTKRANKTIQATNKQLHDYVPLYFGRKTPMASAIREHNDSLLYLAFSFEVLNDLSCVIADGNATNTKTSFRAYGDITDLSILDIKAINSQSYANDEELKRRKQAELLILDFLPIMYLRYVICPSDMVKNTVERQLNTANISASVYVGKSSYYYL